MKGYIRKRGKESYQITIHLGYDKEGKRLTYRETIRGGKRDAENRCSELITRHSKRELHQIVKLTVSDYMDQWSQEVLKATVSLRTQRDYAHLIERHIKPGIGHIKLAQLSPMDVQMFYNDLRKKKLSARSVHHVHTVLASALQQAAKWNYVTRNVARLVDLPPIEHKEMLAMDAEQAKKFIEAAMKDRYYAMWVLALDSGARPEEYLALQWSDFDEEAGTISIQRALCIKKGGWYFGQPKSKTSKRNIYLSPVTVELLQIHREQQTEEQQNAKRWTERNLIFCNKRGNPESLPNLIKRHFKDIVKAAELPLAFRMYDLRHSCATLLLEKNINPKIVQERLGHSTITLTLNTYSHVLPGMQKVARDALHESVFSALSASSRRQLVAKKEKAEEEETL